MNGMKCRTCYSDLRAGGGIISLNSKDPTSNMKVWAKLQLCVPEIELPRTNEEYVCDNCSLQLKSAYNFRSMCLKTEAKFQELYSTIQDGLSQAIIQHSPSNIIPTKKKESPINHSRKKRKLSDEDLVAKACTEIYELQGKEKDLNCNVSVAILPETVVKVTQQKNSVHICSYCRSIFLNQKNFLIHVTKHFENSGTPKEHCNIRCDRCDISFRSSNIYELHLKFMHPEQYGTYLLRDNPDELLDTQTEVLYDEQLSITNKIEKDIKVHSKKRPIVLKIKTSGLFNREKNNPKKCSICFKIFSSYANLVKHLRVHKKNTTMCIACRKHFVDLVSHKRYCKHISKSKDLKKKPNKVFKCPFCEKGFIEKQSFLGHLSVHVKIKVRKCKKCNIQFEGLSNFANHLLAYGCPYPYARKEKSRIICPICSKQQRNKSHLAAHIANHPNKTIPCTSCQTRFRNVPAYMSHITACKRRKRTELVIVKQEEKDDEEQSNLEVQGILQKASNSSADFPDLTEILENRLLDPLKTTEDLENAPNGEQNDNEDVEINLELKRETNNQINTENSTTDVIVQQINRNIKSIIDKMNSDESQLENLSESKHTIFLENVDVVNNVELPIENLNQDSKDSAEVSSSSIIENTAITPSTSTMLTV